jgi:predicted ABC-type sugar transport system permease subunit
MHRLYAFSTVQSGEGVGNEFLFIIAAVVGGCLLTGGYGSPIGAALGAFIFGMTRQGIVFAGWDPNWYRFFLGAMLQHVPRRWSGIVGLRWSRPSLCWSSWGSPRWPEGSS